MAKIKIPFNGTDYQVDESILSVASDELRAHLSTIMNGTGATIKLGGTTYNIDSTKLSTATNSFVSHLGTIAGDGERVVVGETEYFIDSTKVQGAVSELENVLNNLQLIEAPANYLTFSSPSSFTLATYNSTKNWDGTLEYSTDISTWNTWDGTTTLSADSGALYLRGTGNTKISAGDAQWVLLGSDISCNGNIENLLDYATVASGEHPTMAAECYSYMFYDCTALTTAPELPATTLADYCYMRMFQGCTALTSAPELPATTLAKQCYFHMFEDCAALTTAPSLPATTLAEGCYHSMFLGCTSLTTAPELPATTLADYCYSYMFSNCRALTTAPELPATTLTNRCYWTMFSSCTALTTVPLLPATTLAEKCYYFMFSSCEKIKLSSTQTDEYQTAYRIPTSGTGTTASEACNYMFSDTGGTFTGAPKINTTYYLHTSNSVV